MIREIIVDIREGDDSVRKRILDAITRELNFIALESYDFGDDGDGVDKALDHINDQLLPDFPGKVIINVFDENEELMEIIET